MRPLFSILLAAATGAVIVSAINRHTEDLIMPLKEDLEALKGSFGTLSQSIDDFISTHTGDTSALQKALDDMTAARDALQAEVGADNEKIGQLNQAISDAQAAADAADTDIQQLKSAADAANAKLQPA
jgi:chromosome segregation ATPase